MHPSCHSSREALAAHEFAVFEAHALGCADCTAFAARLERNRRELAALAPRSAPADLDGRVVAALEAGEREDRAVRALRRLGRVVVPEHLDIAVARRAAPLGVESLAAPDVLRRLVEEELSDPSKALVGRFVGSLARVTAPAELSSRVESVLTKPAPKRAFRSRLLAGGAGLLLIATAVFAWSLRSEAPKRRQIEWVRVDSVAELSPLAAVFVAGFSGGASELAADRGVR